MTSHDEAMRAEGTFACRICGKDTPHHHPKDQVERLHLLQRLHFELDEPLGNLEKTRDRLYRAGFGVTGIGGGSNFDFEQETLNRERVALFDKIADLQAARAQAATCACGNPLILGVAHRKESPCYVAEEAQAASGEPDMVVELVAQPATGGLHIRKWETGGKLGEGTHSLYTQPQAPSVSVEALPYDGLTEEVTETAAQLANDATGVADAIRTALQACNAVIVPHDDPMPVDNMDVFMQVLSSLVAAVSLLERGGKKAAASDKMFSIMLDDYKKSIVCGRAPISASKKV